MADQSLSKRTDLYLTTAFSKNAGLNFDTSAMDRPSVPAFHFDTAILEQDRYFVLPPRRSDRSYLGVKNRSHKVPTKKCQSALH